LLVDKGQAIFTVLGMLNEYAGRKIARCKDEIECFYPDEESVADIFENCLQCLVSQHNLHTKIRREQTETGHIYFFSEEMNDLICSYYLINGLTDLNSKEVPKYTDDEGYLRYGIGKIGESVFPPTEHPWRLKDDEKQPRLLYLRGANYRYGEENCFSFCNNLHKARLIEELLLQIGVNWVRFTRDLENTPTLNKIEFIPTAELADFLSS
jgi:hypothetical protein